MSIGRPVNSSQLTNAWFTAADDTPRVKVAFSSDGGKSFGRPTRIDSGSPVGRVDVILLPDDAALVSWLELTARGEEYRIRRVEPDGPEHQSLTLAVTRSGRTSGFPRMARSGNEIYFAWTQAIDLPAVPTRDRVVVRTAVAKMKTSEQVSWWARLRLSIGRPD